MPSGPHLHEYLQEMNREVLSKYDVMTVGEAFGVTLEQDALAGGRSPARAEYDLQLRRRAHQSRRGGMTCRGRCRNSKPSTPSTTHALDVHSWNTVFLSNHDNPRIVSAFGDDSPQFRVPSAKLLATMLLTHEGHALHLPGRRAGHDELSLQKHRRVRRYRGQEWVEGERPDQHKVSGDAYRQTCAR